MLVELCRATPQGGWHSAPDALRASAIAAGAPRYNDPTPLGSATLTGRRLREALDAWRGDIEHAIQGGNADTATHLLGTGVVAMPTEAWAAAREHGLLRASRYNAAVDTLAVVQNHLSTHAEAACLSVPARQYLSTIGKLFVIAREVHALRASLEDELRLGGDGVFDGLARTVELLFTERWIDHPRLSRRRGSGTSEDYAEALSELWVMGTALGLNPHVSMTQLPNPAAVLRGDYVKLLKRAMPLRQLVEWERFVDLLDYQCIEVRPDRRYRVSPRDPDVEKSIRFGFIQAEHQALLRTHRALRPDAPSLADFAKWVDARASRALGRPLVERVEQPIPRVRAGVPMVDALHELLASPGLFREEGQMFAVLCTDFGLAVDELQKQVVRDDVTVWDILVFQRLVTVVLEFLRPVFEEIWPREPEVLVASLIPTFPDGMLLELLTPALGAAKAAAVLKLLTWQGAPHYFDIQYTPILAQGTGHSLPASIMAMSNIVRNTLQFTNFRIHHTSGDPGELALAAAIRDAGGVASANVAYRLDKVDWETDVVARLGDLLIVLEIKRPLLPVNMKELQTTLQRAREAAAQLDRFRTHWARDDGRQRILEALGWPPQEVRDMVTVIVLPNRMFSGLRIGGHPVRGLNELGNFIVTGTHSVGVLGGVRLEVPYWRGATLEPDDLRRYLHEDELHRAVFDAMVRREKSIGVGRLVVAQETYALDAAKLTARLAAMPGATIHTDSDTP